MPTEPDLERLRNDIADLYNRDRDRLVNEGTIDSRLRVIEDNRVERAQRRGNMVGAAGVLIAIAGILVGLLK